MDYFDRDYFDPDYFDTDDAPSAGGEGRSGRPSKRRRMAVQQQQAPADPEDWAVLIL